MKLKNFSNYEIYPEEGKVWSIKTNRWVGYKTPNGYWQVILTDDDGKKYHFLLHRLICTAVYGEIPDGMEVNHISENKDENFISNLELVDRKTNVNYGTGIQRSADKRRGKPNPKVAEKLTNNPNRSHQVGAYKDGVLVMVFPSTAEAGRQGFHQGSISQCCRGKRKSHKGFIWRYVG